MVNAKPLVSISIHSEVFNRVEVRTLGSIHPHQTQKARLYGDDLVYWGTVLMEPTPNC